MNRILFFVSLFTGLVCAQSFQIKQITNLDADCRNFAKSGPATYDPRYFVFEAHTGSSSNIYLGRYYPLADSFAVITNVTNDNFININPKLVISGLLDSLFIIYQTNKNGNWDIAYKVYVYDQLSTDHYIANTSMDEINPIVSLIDPGYSAGENQYISYEKGNSVYTKNINLLPTAESEVFHGDDSTKYDQVSLEGPFISKMFVTARKIVNGKAYIVYKQGDADVWGNEHIMVAAGNCHNPAIQLINNLPCLTFTNDIEGKSNIYIIERFYQPVDTIKLIENPLTDYDELITQPPAALQKYNNLNIGNPYTYKVIKNDSLFIRVSKFDSQNLLADTLIPTKVANSSLYLGGMGINNGEICYTFWEDSLDGRIQIFAKKEIGLIVNVRDDYSHLSFVLSQNYPNPFNPSTVISYSLPKASNIKLIVYNTIGQTVKVLEIGFKNAGNYSVNFNASNLPSGIYFYQLDAGQYSQVKKMLFLK
ncbi:MAG: T9SS type A sorting domain-containing protein [Ignavibacteriaceae bacterium]|nr:T9SS type A sorting domain-containing protein [Ignavibacteriaceae bacterium]